MKILLKYIWKNIFEKKGRFILLLLAISISTGLFIGSQKAAETAIGSNEAITMKVLENRNIGFYSKDSSNEVNIKDVNSKLFKNIVPEISLKNLKFFDKKNNFIVSVIGREKKYFPDDLEFKNGNKNDITTNNIIISERTSKEINKKIGEVLSLSINGEDVDLKIKGIVKNTSIFYNDQSSSFVVLMDQDGLSNLTEVQPNLITAEVKNSENTDSVIKEFNKSSKNLIAFNMIDDNQMKAIASQVTSIFMFLFLFVALMSVLIISGAFRLIITERLKTMGTFFSQGASWFQIRFIFLLEAFFYGLIGGIIGIVIGFGIDFTINFMSSPLREYGIYNTTSLSISEIIFGLIFSILLSGLSVIFPLIKLKKMTVKEIILQEMSYESEENPIKFFVGVLLFLISLVLIFFKINIAIIMLGVFAGFIGFILMYTKIVESCMSIIFSKLKNSLPIYSLACQNVGTSKMIRNNITLTTVAVIVLIMINSIGVSFRSVLNDVYKGYDYDLSVQLPASDSESQKEKILNDINKSDVIDEKSDIEHSEIYTSATVNDLVVNITAIDNISNFRNYNQYMELTNKKFNSSFKKIKNDDNTFMSTETYANSLNISVGDKVEFDFGMETKKLTLVGLFDNKTGTNCMLLNQDSLPDVVKLTTATNYYYKTTTSANKAKSKLNNTLEKFDVSIETKKEQTDANTEQNEMMISVFNVFAIMTTIIGSFGILSNVTIGFLQRKKQLALYESLGMKKSQLIKLIFLEGINISILTIILSFPLLLIETKLVEKAMNIMLGAEVSISINFGNLPIVYLFILLLVLIASLPAIMGSRKIQIINELKAD